MSRKLRIVYMGTPEFAVPPLKAILDHGFEIAGVVTAPDKPAGRGRNMRQPAVKEFALSVGLPVLQPLNLKDPEFYDALKSWEANLQFVVAFRMLPESIWRMPELGTFNLHASLLPQYRGAAPINWVLINGEEQTGLTTFRLEHKIDTGNIVFRMPFPVYPEDNAGTLHDRLAAAGGKIVVKTLDTIASGNVTFLRQEELIREGEVLHNAPKLFREHCMIDWNKTSTEIHNLVRGLSPVPAATCQLESPGGELFNLKIYRTSLHGSGSPGKAGSVDTDGKSYLGIQCSDGLLNLLEVQAEGKKRLSIADFLRGFHLDAHWKMR